MLKSTGNQTALIAFLAFAALGVSGGLLGIAWPSMQTQFTQPLDGVSNVYLVQTLAYTLIVFYISRIMARFGSSATLIVGAVIMAASLFGIALAPSWGLVILASMVAGLGTGLIDAGLNLYVATYHTPQQMSFLHASFGVGITVGPLLMTFALQRQLGWQAGYTITAVLCVLVLLILIVTRGIWRNSGLQHSDQQSGLRARFGETLRIPNVWLSMITFLAYVGVEIGIGQWAYTLLVDSRQLAPEVAGPWVSIYWGALTVSRIVFSFIANRFKIATTLRVCLGLIIVGAFLFMWNPAQWVGLGALVLIGVAQGPVFAMLISGTEERVGTRHTANGISIQMGGVGLGTMILPGLIGTIGKNYGLEMMAVTIVILSFVAFGFHELTQRLPHEPALAR